MKRLVLASALAFGFTQTASAQDPCEHRSNVLQNSWIMTLNVDDASSKDDVLNSVRLIGTGGFKVKNILNLGEDAPVLISFNYDSKYYVDQVRAKDVKNNVLGELLGIEGVNVACDSINTISPAIGVR